MLVVALVLIILITFYGYMIDRVRPTDQKNTSISCVYNMKTKQFLSIEKTTIMNGKLIIQSGQEGDCTGQLDLRSMSTNG